MAPRVVLRQAQGAASAVEAIPAAHSIHRTWQAAGPASGTSDPGTATSSVLSGHRRGTGGDIEEGPARPTRPAPPLPGAAVNGGGPSAPGSAATPGGVDVDRLIEAIEERVLAEIERRGGRYTGLF